MSPRMSSEEPPGQAWAGCSTGSGLLHTEWRGPQSSPAPLSPPVPLLPALVAAGDDGSARGRGSPRFSPRLLRAPSIFLMHLSLASFLPGWSGGGTATKRQMVLGDSGSAAVPVPATAPATQGGVAVACRGGRARCARHSRLPPALHRLHRAGRDGKGSAAGERQGWKRAGMGAGGGVCPCPAGGQAEVPGGPPGKEEAGFNPCPSPGLESSPKIAVQKQDHMRGKK